MDMPERYESYERALDGFCAGKRTQEQVFENGWSTTERLVLGLVFNSPRDFWEDVALAWDRLDEYQRSVVHRYNPLMASHAANSEIIR